MASRIYEEGQWEVSLGINIKRDIISEEDPLGVIIAKGNIIEGIEAKA